MINQTKPTNLQHHVYMGDSSRAIVDIMGTIKLKLETNHVLELQEVSFVTLIRMNIIFVSLLDSQGYNFNFGNKRVELFDSI